LKEYFEKERGYPKPNEPLWLPTKTTRRNKPLIRPLGKEAMAMNWLSMIRRLGLVPKEEAKSTAYRTGIAGHETRDAASSLIHRCKLQGFDLDVAEFMKGHVSQIDPNKYDKFYLDKDYVKEQYLIIQPYLNIIRNWQPENKKMIEEAEGLRGEMDNLRNQHKDLMDALRGALRTQLAGMYTPEELAQKGLSDLNDPNRLIGIWAQIPILQAQQYGELAEELDGIRDKVRTWKEKEVTYAIAQNLKVTLASRAHERVSRHWRLTPICSKSRRNKPGSYPRR